MTDPNESEKLKPGQEASAEEEINELTEVVSEFTESDEPIIELTDIAVEAAAEADAPAEDAEENIIELTEVVQKSAEEEGATTAVLEEDGALDEAFSEPADYEPPSDDDFVDTLGVDLDAGIDPPAPPAISSEDVEAAIERVVKEMLSEKIDILLRKVIETEVSKEIERIKNLLLDEAPDMDV